MKERNLFYAQIKRERALKYHERVENSANNGMPDIYFVGKKRHGWLELKYEDFYSHNRRLALRPRQVVWHHKANEFQSVSWILLKAGDPKGDYYIAWPGACAMHLDGKKIHEIIDKAEFFGKKVEFYDWLRELAK